MIILFLDDQDIRHETAEKLLSKEHTVLHAFNADEAIEIISTYKDRVGLAMLDHDLNDKVEEADGYKYERHGVYFIAKMFAEVPEDKWPAQFVVHSHNPEGVRNMISDLRRRDQTCSAATFSGDMVRNLADRIRPQ